MKKTVALFLSVFLLLSVFEMMSLASKGDNSPEDYTTEPLWDATTKTVDYDDEEYITGTPSTAKPAEVKTTARPVEIKTTIAPKQYGWGDITWTLDEDGTLTLSGEGAMNSNFIDSVPNGSAVKKVIVKDGITSINLSAFSTCNNLMEFVLADSVTHIDSGYDEIPWFENQPDGIVYVGHLAYKWKGDIPEQGEIRIKEGTKIICNLLFSKQIIDDSKNIKILLPNSVTTIEDNAFDYCAWLKEITIPKSVTNIGKKAFEYCDNLYILCEKNSAAHKYAEKENIAYGLIDGTEKDNTISGSAGKIKWSIDRLNRVLTVDCTGVMPDFGSIGSPWKDYTKYIKTVILSDGLKNIGENAFSGCSSLKNINLPATVQSIGFSAFYECIMLESIQIPEGVPAIPFFAFHGCESLTSVTIPSSVISIGYEAFANCNKLKKVTVYNPNCEFDSDIFPYITVLYGYPGSTLQTYADQNGLLFKEIGSEEILPGNLDGDDEITAADARIALRAAVGLEVLSEELQAAADVDHDGSITAGDARLILRAAVGLETLA